MFFTGDKMQGINLLKQFLKSMIIAKVISIWIKIVKSEEDERSFESCNKCWICDKLFDVAYSKVRDHCHITGKYRGFAHRSCNINLKLAKKVPVIFHTSRGYSSHLINKEIGKFDVKVSVIPNGLKSAWLLQLTIT